MTGAPLTDIEMSAIAIHAHVGAAITTHDVDRMLASIAHWKANHDHIKLHCSVLRDRPDLPVERLRAYQELCRHLETANARAALPGREEIARALFEQAGGRSPPTLQHGLSVESYYPQADAILALWSKAP